MMHGASIFWQYFSVDILNKKNINHNHAVVFHFNPDQIKAQSVREPNSGSVLVFFGYDSDDICPAAQIGHYHVNRGPRMPSGVTLATVKAIVPLCVWVSLCVHLYVGTTQFVRKTGHTSKVSDTGETDQEKTPKHLKCTLWNSQCTSNDFSLVLEDRQEILT